MGSWIYDLAHPAPVFNENSQGQEGDGASEADPTGNLDDLLKDTVPTRTDKKSPKSDQRDKIGGGGIDQANDDFDNVLKPRDVENKGNGVRSGKLDDGTRVTVRPRNEPTIEVRPPGANKPIKIRYED